MATNNAENGRTPATKRKMKFQEPLFRRYLVKTLKPLSEADPKLVANYIVALLKKNKPKEELQKICIEELQEFLGDNTSAFVAQLFNALEDSRTLASEDDMESRMFADASTAVARCDSTELSSSLQNEKLLSAVVDGFAEHEEQEGSNDEDDDRNHKHTRRATESPSLNWDMQDEVEKGISRKRGMPVNDVQFVLESDTETSKPSRELIPSCKDVEASTKHYKMRHVSHLSMDGDHRRGSQAMHGQAVSPILDSLNGCVRLPVGRAMGVNTGQWATHDSRFPYESVDFSSAMPTFRPPATNLYTGRPILNHGNATNPPWVAFGPMPGMPSGALKQTHLLHTGLQGGRGLSLSSTLRIGMGVGRLRCRDFEERGFCLRGDMCPMEHGANRIVVDDVQSLSQFNLSIPISSRQMLGKGISPSSGPSAGSGRRSSHDKNVGHGLNRDSAHLNASPTCTTGIEADLYDPDQPLLNNAQPEGSCGLRLSPHKKGKDEQLWAGNSPDRHSNDIPDIDDNLGSQRGVGSAGLSHNALPSVWDRIGPVGYACNKSEEGLRIVDASDGDLRHGKQTNRELYDDQGSYSHSEERDEEFDSDQDSGSKDINICLRNIKVRGTSNCQAPMESGNVLPKIAETSGHDTRRNAVHRSNKRGSEKAQRTLFVSCIPPKSNRVESLLSHFRKFGEVLGIHIPPNSDKAFVQYSNREEAEAALTSPDAVMGNRFIRLAWAHWDSTAKQEKISARLVPPGTSSNASSIALPPPQALKQKSRNTTPFNVRVSTSEVPKADSNSAKPVTTKELMRLSASAVQKQEALETLKLIREKQEILAKKREDFRRCLDKLANQGISSRGDSLEKNKAPKRQKTDDSVTCSNNTHSCANLEAVSGLVIRTGIEQVGNNHTSKGLVNEQSGSRSSSLAAITSSLPKLALCSPSGPLTGPISSATLFKLDSVPTSFRVLPPLPYGLMDITALKDHFASFGDLAAVELERVQDECDRTSKIGETCIVRVTYDTHHAAKRAFTAGGYWQGQKLQLAWVIISNAANQGSRKNVVPKNSNWDSSRGALLEKETGGGETVTTSNMTNKDEALAEN